MYVCMHVFWGHLEGYVKGYVELSGMKKINLNKNFSCWNSFWRYWAHLCCCTPRGKKKKRDHIDLSTTYLRFVPPSSWIRMQMALALQVEAQVGHSGGNPHHLQVSELCCLTFFKFFQDLQGVQNKMLSCQFTSAVNFGDFGSSLVDNLTQGNEGCLKWSDEVMKWRSNCSNPMTRPRPLQVGPERCMWVIGLASWWYCCRI